MLLYSGPMNPNDFNPVSFYLISSLHYYTRYYNIFENLNRVGCIYTGDTNLNKVKIGDIFNEKYLDSVGTIQIPHHGSIENFNEDFFDDNKKKSYFCPISVGSNNSYGHPSCSVINSIFFNNSLPIIISDSLDSLFIQTIHTSYEKE